MLLAASNICKSIGQNVILNDISFNINNYEKIGIIGRNGAGKTTLFNIISCNDTADSGSIIKPESVRIGMLSQMPDLDLAKNAYENLLCVFNYFIDLEKEISHIQKQISDFADNKEKSDKLLDKYSKYIEKYEKNGGYSYPSLIKGALNGFGFSADEQQRPVSTLSGGQQNKIAFIKLLLLKPDLLLLDEPTNYFDIQTIIWLENYLKSYTGAVLIISHDRYFLDSLCSRIFEIQNSKLTVYNGNYSDYINLKRKKEEEEYNKFIQQKKEIARQEQIIAQYRQYNKEKSVKQADSRQKKLDKIARLEKPDIDKHFFDLSFKCEMPSGKNVVEISGLSKSFGSNKIINNFSHIFYKKQKTGIFGANGIGKSTLLKIISNIDSDYSGDVILGHNVKLAYGEQYFNFEHKTVLEEILYINNQSLSIKQARDFLALFLFFENDISKEISSLSGGEKSRLNLIKVMIQGANLIILDEPSNHLDIASVEALEDALINFDGTLVMVSHDRYFLNKVCDNMLVFEDNTIKHYAGNYDYYLSRKEKQDIIDNKKIEQARKPKQALKDNNQRKLSLRIKELEKLITDTEYEIKKTEAIICNPDFYKDDKSKEIIIEYEHKKSLLDQFENEWLELTDKLV